MAVGINRTTVLSRFLRRETRRWRSLSDRPLIPAAKPGGRHREVEIWSVLNAIFYVLTQGCTWRNLPGDIRRMADSVYLLSELEKRWNMGRNS
jgi:transposase